MDFDDYSRHDATSLAALVAQGEVTTGTPSMSVPLYYTADGLPLGVQFVAPCGREDVLLQLAHQLEGALPWFDRLPAMTRKGSKSTSADEVTPARAISKLKQRHPGEGRDPVP